MDFLISLAEGFVGMFQAGADVFMGYMTGIIPLLVTLITAVNALVAMIGEDKVNRFMEKLTKFSILRYTLMPFLAVFFFTNPMCYTVGRFIPEHQKAAYYDATVSMVHPITGLFPHGNSAELFVYLGIAQGFGMVENQSKLALFYLAAGFLVILVRGILTERIYDFLAKRRKVAQAA